MLGWEQPSWMIFMVSIRLFRLMPGLYLNYAITTSFQILCSSSFISHPTIQCCILTSL
jgi:hypothetical protein